MMCSAEQRVQARNKEKVWNSRKKGSNTGTLGKKCQDGRCAVVLWWSPCWFSVTKSCLTLWDSMDYSTPGFPVLHFLPEFAQTHVPRVSDATILPSVTPFSSCPQFFPASGCFSVSWLFASGSQSIGASALLSVLLMTIQGWLPLGLTDLISLLSKGRSRVFSNTTVQKPQFFGTQPSLWSNSHTHNWKNHSFDYTDLCH